MDYSQCFARFSFLKRQYSLPLRVQDFLEYMQKAIRKQQKSFFICASSKRTTVDEHFARAFRSLNQRQQVAMFQSYLSYLECYVDNKPRPEDELKKDQYEFEVGIREGTFGHSWVKYDLVVEAKGMSAAISGNGQRYKVDLHDFLIRRSKTHEKPCFVLEATRNNLRKSTRFGFDSEIEYENCFYVLSTVIRRAQYQNLERYMASYQQLKKSMQSKKSPRKGEISQLTENKTPTKKILTPVKEPTPKPPINDLKGQPFQESQEDVRDVTIVDVLLEDKQEIDIIEEIAKENEIAQEIGDKKNEKMLLSLVHTDQSKSFVEEIEEIKRKKDLDIFHKLMPDYNLQDLQQQTQFRLIRTIGKFRILRHDARLFMYRLNGTIPYDLTTTISILLDISKYRQWNQQVQLGDIKIRIISQNSAILYQKHKPYNRFYRSRDYLFLRHVFMQGQNHYIVDKSIENSHYPPFSNIIRGNIKACIWCLKERKGETEVTVEIDVQHEGFLTTDQQEQLTERFLVGVANLEGYVGRDGKKGGKGGAAAAGGGGSVDRCFDLRWDIGRNSMNKSMIKGNRERRKSKLLRFDPPKKQEEESSEFSQNLCSEIEQAEFFTAHGGESYEQMAELNKISFIKQLDRNSKVFQEQKKQLSQPSQNVEVKADCQLDANGLAVLPLGYLNKKHRMKPFQNSQWKPVNFPQYKHYILKDQWAIDHTVGLKFIDQKKIDAQKGVLKFILGKLGKNLLSGKGITGISLPVDVFQAVSYLQKTASSFGVAPKFFEKACKSQDPVQRMKYVMVFALSHSINFIIMEKPFNPILGETFQGWLNGCPIFLEQISHHPPISAFFMQGRGYKIYGNFQAKLDLSINSGIGTNNGEYIVQFEDTHQKVRWRPNGGQASGLTYGTRCFNFVSKYLIYDYENCLFCQVVFNPTKKGFFSVGKQQKQADYFQGSIVKVKKQWLDEFKKSHHKKQGPSSKHVLGQCSKVNGLWTEYTKFDGVQYYNLERDPPCILEYEKFPLNSNSNYREDIIYLRAKDLARAQLEKDRLEEIQRADRKWRAKFAKGGSHH